MIGNQGTTRIGRQRGGRLAHRGRAAGILAAVVVGCALPASASAGGAPTNDNFPGEDLGTTFPTSDTGTNVDATKEANEPPTIGEHANGGGASVWWSWTAPSDGTVEVNTCGSDFDTLLGVYTGGSLPVTLVADNDDSHSCGAGSLESQVVFEAIATTTYRILVDGYDADEGAISLSIEAPPPPVEPPNNDLANAEVIPNDDLDNMLSLVADNTLADKEADENDHAGNAGGHSLWYQWTAPQTGDYVAFTCGSNIDSLLGLYTDPDSPGPFPLAEVDSSDNTGCGPGDADDGLVTFPATVGDVFKFAVDGKDGDTGDFVGLGIEVFVPPPPPPANDDFAAAEVLSGLSDTASGVIDGATAEPGEPDHGANTPFPGNLPLSSVWYAWTAPQSGQATIDLCASTFDTMLAIYTGAAVNALTPVADDDDFCGVEAGSRVAFAAVANTPYKIAVDDWMAPLGGDIALSLNLVPDTVTPPTPPGDGGGGGSTIDQAACDAANDALAAAKAKLKKAKKRLKKAKASGDEDAIKKAKKAVKRAKKRVAAAQAAVETACAPRPAKAVQKYGADTAGYRIRSR